MGIIVFFIVLHMLFGAQFDIFNLDRERTPAAIFSALQFIATGYALCTLYFLSATRSQRMLWGSLGLLFVLLGLDEISELHENAAYYLVKYVPPFPFFQSGTPMWIVFLSPVILGALILLVIALRRVYADNWKAGRLLVGAVLFVLAALVLEFLGGAIVFQTLLPVFVVLEEGAELFAGAFFLFGFSLYAKEKFCAHFVKK